MLERRKYKRFETEINVKVSTVGFIANTDANCLMSDVSFGGARIITPIFLQDGEEIKIEIPILGGPLVIDGKIVGCREDYTAKKRFDKTYSVNVKFSKVLTDREWKDLMAFK